MPTRITVKVTEELHRDVRVKAARLGKPVSVIVRTLLRKWTRGEEEDNAKDES
jgi:plasmid stability protein